MKQLNFVKNSVAGTWTAEFVAESNFALHIERKSSGTIEMCQSSVQGADYAPVRKFAAEYSGFSTIDCTITNEVFPMYIKIVSKTEPTMAVAIEA